MSPAELAELADSFLDGELDAAAWEVARTTHGPALDRALTRAQAVRTALAGLDRPPLPTALRDRVLAAAPRTVIGRNGPNPAPSSTPPPPRRGRWWRVAIPITAFALIMAALFVQRDAASPAPTPAPTVAKLETRVQRRDDREELVGEPLAKKDANATPAAAEQAASVLRLKDEHLEPEEKATLDRGLSRNAAPNREIAAFGGAEAGKGQDALDAMPAAAPKPGALPAAPAAVTAAPKPMDSDLHGGNVSGLLLAAVWHVADAEGVRQQRDKSQATAEALAPDAGAPAEANVPAERILRISLQNPTAEPVRLVAGSIRLVMLNAGGHGLWRTPLRGDRETVVPPGQTLTWDEPMPVIPPGAVHLRVETQGLRSADLTP